MKISMIFCHKLADFSAFLRQQNYGLLTEVATSGTVFAYKCPPLNIGGFARLDEEDMRGPQTWGQPEDRNPYYGSMVST